MTLNDLNTVQKISKEILFDIVDVCERNQIEYFLLYGSLLGAVRHKGMIPWDDDIDIGMTRENYEKFLRVAPSEIDQRNEIRIMGSRKYLSELKIGRKGTLYCLKDAAHLNIASQVTVDIFLIDYLKDLGERQRLLYGKLRNFLRICSLPWDEKKLLIICIKKSSHRFKVMYILGLYFMHLIRCCVGEDAFNSVIQKMYIDPSGESGRMGCAMFDDYSYPANSRIIKLPFDGRSLSALDCYNEILVKQYGDYMKFPPVEKRYNTHMDEWIFKVTS